MMVLVTGGAKNGKSSHAERIFDGFAGEKIYIATMEPYGEEAWAAIRRHRAVRAGKGFCTVEKYHNIGELELPEGCGVLLECMSTLCANEMFAGGEEAAEEGTGDGSFAGGGEEAAGRRDPAGQILAGIDRLRARARRLVIVTNDVGSDGISYGEGTAAYIRVLGRLNRELARRADCVLECVFGIPVLLKGDWPWES